jgi:hypothetical protein
MLIYRDHISKAPRSRRAITEPVAWHKADILGRHADRLSIHAEYPMKAFHRKKPDESLHSHAAKDGGEEALESDREAERLNRQLQQE